MSTPHENAGIQITSPDAERQALREIAGQGDILNVDGQPYILAPVSPATVDALAALEADTADMEPNGDYEPSVGSPDDTEADSSDYEPDYDNEPDCRDHPVPDYGDDPERPQWFENGACQWGGRSKETEQPKPLVMANPATGELGRWKRIGGAK